MKEIKAREGYYLTQRAEVDDRIFVTAIKGVNIIEADWKEVPKEEKEKYEEMMNTNQLEFNNIE